MSNTTGRICPRGASYYVWQAGDTLESVAQANSITVQAIRIINEDVDFATVAAGDTICLPPRQLTCLSGQTYTVQAGDTFSAIAQRFGITALELAERNPYVTPDNLLVGQVICVPSQTGGSTNGNGSQPGLSCPVGSSARQIQQGQTFADLLIANDVSYRAMRLYNPQLNPGALLAGQYYCAPAAGTRGLCASGQSVYVILEGEDLPLLAAKLNTTQGTLLQLNSRLAPSDFKAGQTICVP
ncbi:MAG: LysM peptidoglycan-binding domain-containing protein [Clostridia bacterium]|nr:LysM peptidoglycan-binding domain-containing protein [Clostridia bacterium]